MSRFVRPAERYGKEVTTSLVRILQDIDSVGVRREVYSYAKEISILPPVVANEIYLIFGNDESKRQDLFDAIFLKATSYQIYDWIVDRELASKRYREAEIITKLLDEISSKKLASCGPNAPGYFATNITPFIEAMWDEYVIEPSLENRMRLYNKKASLYKAMFGVAAVVGGASDQELSHVEKFGKNVYKSAKTMDDMEDYPGDKKWNLVTYLGKKKTEEMGEKMKQKAKENISALGTNKHVEYLIGILDYLY